MRRVLAVLVGAGIVVGGAAAVASAHPGPNREAARACMAEARQADPDADRAALRDAVRDCLKEAGIEPGPLRARLAELRQSRTQVKADHPDADRAELRRLVRECVQAG